MEKVCDAFKNKIKNKFLYAFKRPTLKKLHLFTCAEVLTIFDILIASNLIQNRQSKENLNDTWKVVALTLTRAAMSCDRFKMMLRFIRFHNEKIRAESTQIDKAASKETYK